MWNKGSTALASDWLRRPLSVTLSTRLLLLIPHAEAANPAVIYTVQWNTSEQAAPPTLLLLSGLLSTWLSVTGRNAARGSLGVSATCYVNVINQQRPDCLRCDSEDLRAPAVHRYLPLLLSSTSFSLFFFCDEERRERQGGKKNSFARPPQDGALNDGHRSFSNKFHGAWS